MNQHPAFALRRVLLASSILLIAIREEPLCAAPSFTVIPLTLGGSRCAVERISEGRAVGWATIPGDSEIHAFTWTEATGMVDIGTLGGSQSRARTVDGDRVAGWSLTAGDAELHAFSWTPTEGLRDLGTLGGSESYANAVSEGIIVGESLTPVSSRYKPFMWTDLGGMVPLPTFPGGADSVVVSIHQGLAAGYSTTTTDAKSGRPVAWNAAGQLLDIVNQPIEPLPFGLVRGGGAATSVRDGMVVGHSILSAPSLNYTAFAWTSEGGIVDLGTLPGFNESFALATSSGQVVGFLSGSAGVLNRPFSWTSAGGLIDLGTLGGSARATHVSNGKVVGWFVSLEFGGSRPFLWTRKRHGRDHTS